MLILITTYPNNSRQLKKFILGLIKGGIAKCINRINYVKSYYMREGKLNQEEEKILLIKAPTENKTKLEEYIKKNHPYKCPEIIYLTPEQVGELYLKWINE